MEEVKKLGNVTVVIDDSLVEIENVAFILNQLQDIRNRSINEQARESRRIKKSN